MNKYEKLFDEIYAQTKAGTLQWKQLPRQANTDLIFDSSQVWRQFAADFERDNNTFKILLIEKKYVATDFDFAYEKYVPELLVVDNGELVASLTDSVIERTDMIRLISSVETKSDRAKKLFGA